VEKAPGLEKLTRYRLGMTCREYSRRNLKY
jgi:hypothetical protein